MAHRRTRQLANVAGRAAEGIAMSGSVASVAPVGNESRLAGQRSRNGGGASRGGQENLG